VWGCIQVVSPSLALRQSERRYYLCRIGKDDQAACCTDSALTRHNPARGIMPQNAHCAQLSWEGKIIYSMDRMPEVNAQRRSTG
jgi:hypothetical protein